MTSYEIIKIGNIIVKHDDKKISLPSEIKNIIDATWDSLLKKDKTLFNGKSPIFLKLDENQENTLSVTFVDYKVIIVDRMLSNLGLNLNQVGISGMIVLDDPEGKLVLFSKRSKNTNEYPGLYELVPSGNLDISSLQVDDIINYKSKIMDEFEEETCVSKTSIKNVQTLGLVKDCQNNVYDICCLLEVTISPKELLASIEMVSEYYKPKLIKINELSKFVSENRNCIVPTSKAIIQCYNQKIKS